MCLISGSFAKQAVFYHPELRGPLVRLPAWFPRGDLGPRPAGNQQEDQPSRGHPVLSQKRLLLQLPGSAERAVHLDIVFDMLRWKLMEFSCDFPWHTCIFLIKVVGWHSNKKRLGMVRQGCHSVLWSLCLPLSVSELFLYCKILLFHGQWTWKIYLILSVVRNVIPGWLLIYKLHFLTLAQCLPPGLRGLQLGSVKIVLFSLPKLSFLFCTCCNKCICSRDHCKERPLGNCKEITKGCLDGNDFQSLRLWQPSWKQEIPPPVPQALSQSSSSLYSESLSHVRGD